MPESKPRPPNTPPVFAATLLAVGLASAAAGLWLGQIDVAGFVERQIVQAKGNVSAETVAWLRDSPVATGLLLSGFVLAGLGVLAFRFRPAIQRLVERFATDSTGPRGLGVACLAVIFWYFPTLRAGYFRYDDFQLLAVAQDGAFWPTLWQPHGDHILPLTRLLALAGLHLFGVTAWPYNLSLWLCLSAVLVMGMLLLSEMKVSRPAQWVFVGLVLFWSPWAEMMTGYYILSTYLLIAGLGLASAWFFLRWRRTGRNRDAAGLAGCALLAPLIDVSGCYVIGIGGVFLGLDYFDRSTGTGLRKWLNERKSPLVALTLAATFGGVCLLYAYRIAHPGVFLGMADGDGRTVVQVVRDLGYLLGTGTLLSMVTPFVYARLPAVLLGGLTTTFIVAWLMFLILAFRAAGKSRRLVLIAILFVVLGAGLMVVLGRPTSQAWIVRWAAKHICPVYLWLCLHFAVGWDALWLKLAMQRRLLFAELTVIALASFVALQGAFGLLGMATDFPPFGYRAELRDAERRRDAVEELRTHLIKVLADGLGRGAVVPTLDGEYIKASCPSLFSYNLSHYRPFFGDLSGGMKLIRNPAMQPWHAKAVETVPVLRDAVSPGFLQLLNDDPQLRTLYLAKVPLAVQTVSDRTLAGGRTIESNGRAEIVLQAETWDPESAPLLQLAVRDSALSRDLPVTVTFWSESLHADWRGTMVLRGVTDQISEVDLRQVYAFSLSHRVANLRVMLPEPGRYWFRLAEATP